MLVMVRVLNEGGYDEVSVLFGSVENNAHQKMKDKLVEKYNVDLEKEFVENEEEDANMYESYYAIRVIEQI